MPLNFIKLEVPHQDFNLARGIERWIYTNKKNDKESLFIKQNLNKTNIFQVSSYNNIIDGSHDKLDLIGIGSTSEMRIDLLFLTLVKASEFLDHKLRSWFKFIGSCIKNFVP
jgi:hypothetical protein